MMRLMIKWSEIHTYEFPDEAPTDDIDALFDYVDNHPDADGDFSYFATSIESLNPEFIKEEMDAIGRDG